MNFKSKKNSVWVALALTLMLALGVACIPATSAEPEGESEETSEGVVEEPDIIPEAEGESQTVFVGPELVDCVGVAPQKCMQVKFEESAEWEFFYSTIDGFEFEPGFEYELLVNKFDVENPPAEAPSIRYELVELVSKTAVSAESPEIIGQVWQWLSFEDSADLNNIAVDSPTSYTLEFLSDGTYHIQADCNSGSGRYTLNGNSLTLQPGVMTLAHCGPDSLDTDFLAKLAEVVTFVFDADGRLVLNLKLDLGNIVFAAAEENTVSLEGSRWTLSVIVEGGDMVTTDTDITAEFKEGQLAGSAGCNNYFTNFEADETTLTLGPIGSTRKLCDEARNEREQQFLTALEKVESYNLTEEVLELVDGSGQPVLIFTAA